MSEHSASSSAIRTLSAALCAGAVIGFSSGCIIINKSHCGYTEAGADNPCPDGYVCSMCAVENNGCVPIDQKDSIKTECLMGATSGTTTTQATSTTDPTDTTTIAPPTTTTATTVAPTTDTDTTTSTGTDTSAVTETSTTDTTETSSTTMPVECMGDIVDETCSPKYCLPTGVCGGCQGFPDGTTCEGLSPDKPVCDGDSGVCSECSADDVSHCPVEQPACDTETGMCTECTEHAQCPDTACDIETGMCFPKERVYYVKGSVNCPGDGTFGKPFCDFAGVPIEVGQPTTIKVIASGTSSGPLSLPAGAVVAIVREGNQFPILTAAGNLFPTLQVTGGGTRVYTWRVQFRDGHGSVARCTNGAHLWLHDTTIFSDNTDDARAIEASGCDVRVVRSMINDCGNGIQVANGDLRVESSFLISNGNNGQFGAFNFVSNAKARVVFSTMVLNHASPSTFTCTGVGTKDVVIRNSAVVGMMPLSSPDCVSFDGGVTKEAVDMNDLTATMTGWFTLHPSGYYTPKLSGGVDPLEEQAEWAPGDPLFDFTGDPIPQQGKVWAGADQPPG